MAEKPRQKKSLDDFIHIPGYGIEYGLLPDAKSMWNTALLAATMFEEIESMSPPELERLREIFLRPLPTYREYLEKGYSSEAVEAILNNPGTDLQKIQQHDALVNEFNSLAGGGTIDPKRALDIYERAMKLFGDINNT